jgi:hypothetical protein
MKKIIVILMRPAKDIEPFVSTWNHVLREVRKTTQKTEGWQEWTEGQFWITASSGLPILGASIFHADRNGIPYRVVFLEDGDDWLYEAPIPAAGEPQR